MRKRNLLVLMVLISTGLHLNAQENPVYSWSFDKITDSKLSRDKSDELDPVSGNYSLVEGVQGGKALRLDGYSTSIQAKSTKEINGSFTIEAWVSQSAYPWNWAPILSHQTYNGSYKSGFNQIGKRGFYFGVGPRGEIGLDIWIKDEQYRCMTPDFTLELFKWNHVAAVYKENDGIYLYCNGVEKGYRAVDDTYVGPTKGTMFLGMNEEPANPAEMHRPQGTLPAYFSIDGAMDNLKVYDTALNKDQLAYNPNTGIPEDGSLEKINMPTIIDRDEFSAFYTKLKYYKQWDQLWPVAGHPDIVITFEDSPVRMVFWRGTRFSPAWLSEDDFWMADQSVEAWGVGENDTEGTFEHMNDKHCRYSHVRILENTPARILVHWRYVPVSTSNMLWRVDPKTDWACWVDEYYYVYPDGTAIRNVQWNKDDLGFPRQLQESLGLTGHGQKRSDILEKTWLTVANQEGEQKDFVYTENPDMSVARDLAEKFNIQQHQFKSDYDPFIVFEEGNRMHGLHDKDIRNYNKPGEFNHWPVGQFPSDGRSCVATDRPAHFISYPKTYPVIRKSETREWWNGLYGMTTKSVDDLVTISKSWNNHPAVKRSGGSGLTYDKAQRAYIEQQFSGSSLSYEVNASEENPLENMALVIQDCKHEDVDVLIDGKKLKDKQYKVGTVDNGLKKSMIVWIEKSTRKPFDIEVTAK